jgi:hypothetical protein
MKLCGVFYKLAVIKDIAGLPWVDVNPWQIGFYPRAFEPVILMD